MCGGDGATGWSFEGIGMDVANFSETGAAIIHNIEGDAFSHLIWPTNYCKLTEYGKHQVQKRCYHYSHNKYQFEYL